MFRQDETVCVSHNKYGYHSIPLSEILTKESITLVPTVDSCEKRNIEWKPENFEKINPRQITLVSLNPIKGWREDSNCTAYRSFLIEIDVGSIKDQLAYIKHTGVPYSAIVFSGNKSLHTLVCLDQDLPSEGVYRFFSEWLLKAIPLADQKTKNPSRGIRLPGAYREPGKKQVLVDFKGYVKMTELVMWLGQHMEAKPEKQEKRVPTGQYDFSRIKPWAISRLVNGLDPTKGRNQQWYSIAYEFALSGYSEDDTLQILGEYFTPDRDFKEREWKTAIKSAFKHVYEK